jgi:hypothetical protein
MHIAKLKDGPKRAMKLSQMILERVFENGMMEGEKIDSHKKILKLKCFSPLKILTSPFYLQRLLELFFLPLFFLQYFFLLSFFSMLGLFEDLGILIIKMRRKTLFKNFFSDEMEWNG